MSIPKNLADCRILLSAPISFSYMRPLISEDLFHLTTVPSADPRVISFPHGSHVDMEELMTKLPHGWYPDVFISWVNAFFYLVPVNIAALKCPKILVIGDTHHGTEPLQRTISYAQQEQFDFYITTFDRHHIWYYSLAGIKDFYWFPNLLVTQPSPSFQELPYQQPDITDKVFQDKAIFIGNLGKWHPLRRRIVEYLSRQIPNFFYGQLSLEDSFKAFRQASISLNISLNGDVNMRNFEIISSGGFLLSERLSDETGMNLILEEGKDYEAFSGLQELTDKIRYFTAESSEFSLSYRQASYDKYLRVLSPIQAILRLEKLLQGQVIEDIFTSQSVKRIQYFKDEGLSLARIQLYELIQNIHRVWDEVIISIDTHVDFAYAIDFLDLNRVRIILQNHERGNPSYDRADNLIAYLGASNNLSRVKFVDNYLEEKINIIITSTCDPATLSRLIQKNALIISHDYQGLLASAEHPEFAYLQWGQDVSSNIFFVINGNVDQEKISLIDFISWQNFPVGTPSSLIDNLDLVNALDLLDLREINLLLCPNWEQPEDALSEELLEILTPIFRSSQVEKIAIVICIDHEQEEIANLLLSSVVMDILIQGDSESRAEDFIENSAITGEPGIVIYDRTDLSLWQVLLPAINYRLPLASEKIAGIPDINTIPLGHGIDLS